MLIESKNGLTVLYAEGTKKITNSEKTFFSDFIYLGKNDSADNYEEVDRDIWKNFVREENPDILELTARTDDLKGVTDSATKSIEELQETTNTLNESQLMSGEIDNIIMEAITDSDEKHEALTDVMLCAIDEVFMMLDPLISVSEEVVMSMENSEQLNELLNKEVNKMVELYVVMVQRGLKTIEQVPARYREQVRELLANVE